MGKGTADESYLNEFEKKIIKFCKEIIDFTVNFLKLEKELKKNFLETWGKIGKTRWAGAGRGAGKLQRDNLHTRGQGAKNPLSNRNFRWTPLVIAKNLPPWAKEVKEIKYEEIEIKIEKGRGKKKKEETKKVKAFVYIVEKDNKYMEIKPGKEVYNLPLNEPPYCITQAQFNNFWDNLDDSKKEEIKNFTDLDWTINATMIPAYEYSYWTFSIESFLVCLLSVASTLYYKNNKISDLKASIVEKWEKFLEENEEHIPVIKNNENKKEKQVSLTTLSSISIEELQLCPLCKTLLTQFPAGLEKENRPENWSASSFPWKTSKKKEGEKESIQLLHIKPLIETEIRHSPDNVRYGHRWCNVAMADASLEYTLDFFEHVLKNNNRC